MSKSSELDKKVKQYLINAIDCDYCETESDDTSEIIAACQRAFYAEKDWHIAQVGEQIALRDWLQGLPSAINIAFYNVDILKLAHEWGSLPENPTEEQEDKILENYWSFMANKLGQLFRGYHVPKEEA